jgi:EpsI family protein
MMPRLSAYAPALILAGGYLMVAGARGQKAVELAGPIEGVLASAEGYRVQNQKLSDEERRVAGMTNYVVRTYSRDSVLAFTTLVAYYDRQTRGKSIHSPRNCLPGAGWAVLSGGTETVTANGASYVVNRYMLKNGPARAVVYYWYQGRGRVVANEYAVKWNLLRDAAFKGHTEEALVRVVVPVYGPDGVVPSKTEPAVVEARALGRGVAQRLIGEVNRILPHSGPA